MEAAQHTAPRRPVDRLPRWLAGDWSPIVRDPLDLLRLALLLGAPITLALGPREQSFRLALTFLLVLIPRALDVPRPFDLAFIVAMSFQAWGNVFGAFDHIYGYDKIVHFVLPLSTSALLYLLLVRLRVVPDLRDEVGSRARAGIVVVTWALGLTLAGALYELYEWFADHSLGAPRGLGRARLGHAPAAGSPDGPRLTICRAPRRAGGTLPTLMDGGALRRSGRAVSCG